MSKPWYHKGLHFDCTGCGKCCTGAPGYIWVTVDEIEAIAEHLNLSVDEFSQKYVRRVGNRYSLRELPGEGYRCIFLEDKKCQIYEKRPTQCRTYPFWPNILESEKAWESEAKECEGISKEKRCVSLSEILERSKS